jgi:predicted LPLAT superfamily acyltransferase
LVTKEVIMVSWEGKSKGRVLGYKIFGWGLKYLGVNFVYFLLYFVSFYFVLASGKTFRTGFYYFHTRLGYSKIKTVISIFKNYYLFGQVLIDKAVVLGGFKNKLTFQLEGKEYLNQMQDGGVLISGHIGNWEIGGQVLDFLGKKINIVILDAEREAIKNYMSGVLTERNVNFVTIQDDLSHLFKIKEALENKEIVALPGDRFIDKNKTVKIPFLGEPAHFPLGPWQIVSNFNKPVSYVFAIKETRNKYRFYATPLKEIPPSVNYRDREEIITSVVKDYVAELETIVRKYPLQWFNYYDFWARVPD